jgi:hypothetical protein
VKWWMESDEKPLQTGSTERQPLFCEGLTERNWRIKRQIRLTHRATRLLYLSLSSARSIVIVCLHVVRFLILIRRFKHLIDICFHFPIEFQSRSTLYITANRTEGGEAKTNRKDLCLISTSPRESLLLSFALKSHLAFSLLRISISFIQ